MRFENRVVLITGAGGNIGKETAKHFSGEGAYLALTDIDGNALERVKKEINVPDDKILLITADVSRESDVEMYVRRTMERFGKIDCFFNNAGVGGERQQITELDLEEWNRVVDVNLRGVLLGLKYVLRVMCDQGYGSVINTASQAGLFNQPGGAGYCVTKGAVIHLTKIAAVEVGGFGIRINCILPGLVNSDMVRRNTGKNRPDDEGLKSMVPLGRMAELDEVAKAVCFLASDDAAFITGAELRIDGGSSIK